MGGDCLNYGCVPSKALIAAAKAAQAQRSGAAFGIAPVEPQVDFGRVMDHVTGVIAAIAPNDSVERFEGLGVRVLKEEARFVGRTELSAGPHRIRSKRIVLATGSRPTAPPIAGLGDVPYLTNETVFANRTLPGHLIVIGGGPIGLELAQAFRRLGARVTVLEAVDFLAKDDPELAAIVVARLRAEGVDLRAPVKIARVERAAAGIGRDARRRRTPGRLAPAGRGRPRAHHRGTRPRDRRHRPHQARHHGRCLAAHVQPQRLGDRRLQRPLCLHPHGGLRGVAVHPRRPVPRARAPRSPRSCRGRPIPTPSWPRSA